MYSLIIIVSKLYSSHCIQSFETRKPGEGLSNLSEAHSLFRFSEHSLGCLKQMAAIIFPVPVFTISLVALWIS